MREEKKNWIKRHKMAVLVAVSTVVMIVGLSYAWLQITLFGEKELTLHAGSLSLVLDDSMTGGITIESAEPVLDEVGMSQEGYTFTLQNNGSLASSYTIYLDDLSLAEGDARMPDEVVKISLTKEEEETTQLLSETVIDGQRVLDAGEIEKNSTYTYTLKMWIDESAGNEIMGTVFKGQLRIEAMQSMNKRSAVDTLLKKVNKIGSSYENVGDDEKKEMFTFSHEAGEQQSGWSDSELTDYRYIGTDPNNYVTFNDEVWRMIGVFTVEDDTGKKEQRIKLIREESIGIYSFDNRESNGSNDWSTSVLQKVLNSGVYYNRTSGECPYGGSGGTKICNFTSKGLTSKAKSMIGKAKWYLGGYNLTTATNTNASQAYEYERGTRVYTGKSTSWTGEVGLMYASDYGYAASGSSCLNTALVSYNSSCMNTDWLFDSSYRWTIVPYSNGSSQVFYVHSTGYVNYNSADETTRSVFPSIYLKSSVVISDGDGSSSNPYQLKF